MLSLLALVTLLTGNSKAMVMPPTQNAAEALGYNVAGEIEFSSRSVAPRKQQFLASLAEIRELCPRTQITNAPVTKATNIIVLAWSDREFPGDDQRISAIDLALADQRAQRVAGLLRRELQGQTNFELVNMASRRAHPVRVSSRAQVTGPLYDIKSAMKIAGAAPSGRLEAGLFGEYGQSSKALVWVECTEAFTKRPVSQRAVLQMARGKAPLQRGVFERSPLQLARLAF